MRSGGSLGYFDKEEDAAAAYRAAAANVAAGALGLGTVPHACIRPYDDECVDTGPIIVYMVTDTALYSTCL